MSRNRRNLSAGVIIGLLFVVLPVKQVTAAEHVDSLPFLGGIDWYVSGRGGLNWLNSKSRTKFETGYMVGGAAGVYVSNNIRMEVEGLIRKNVFRRNGITFQDTDGKMTTVMLNGVYDIPTTGRLTPFVGAGLGYAHYGVQNSSGFQVLPGILIGGEARTKEDLFVWQAIAGASVAVTEHIGASIEGRFLGTDGTPDSNFGSNGENWSVLFGLRWNFRPRIVAPRGQR